MEELEDANEKFDRLATIYENQWKDLEKLNQEVRQMKDDITLYQEVCRH